MALLTRDQIAVVTNDLEEKVWSSYRIWKKHSTFNCSRNTLINLVNISSGKKATEATLENEELAEELICSQEDRPGTHYSIKEFTSARSVFKTSIPVCLKEKVFVYPSI